MDKRFVAGGLSFIAFTLVVACKPSLIPTNKPVSIASPGIVVSPMNQVQKIKGQAFIPRLTTPARSPAFTAARLAFAD